MLEKVIKDCLHFKRLLTKPIPFLMGDLLYDRIEIGQPPLYNTGIDQFGPTLTKQSRRTRSITGKTEQWGALFTFLNTQAMHLAIVWALTPDLFILTLRFYSRRGYPYVIQSENGKNFIGAESEVKTALKGLDKKRTNEEINSNQMKWLFNPPCSPWMSGAMESMVKITKLPLKTKIEKGTFTDECILHHYE